jgi:hypothetical protein
MGRIGVNPGTYELIQRPYIIVYEVREQRNEIVVLAVFPRRARSPITGCYEGGWDDRRSST